MLVTWLFRRLLVLALVLAIPLVGGELAARSLIGDAVASAVRARIGGAPNVSFGARPLLLQLVDGRLADVRIGASGAHLSGLGPLGLSATLHDVHLTHLTSLEGAIGSLTVDARVAPPQVGDMLATAACVGSLPAPLRAALTPAPRIVILPGRIDLLPPAGRAVELRLTPSATGAVVAFALAGLDRGGAPATAGELAALRSQVNCARVLPNLPFGITLRSATAVRGALVLALAGRGASFSALG